MESLQEKAQLADQRIQQLKSLISTIGTGQLDSDVYTQVLQEENTRLKARVEDLVKELTTLENQRGVTQQYDFESKTPKAPSQSVKPIEVPQAAEGKDKKDKKKPAAKEGKPAPNTKIDISRFDLRVGKIIAVEKHPDADTLYVEQIDVGEEKPRTICSGLVKHMQPSDVDQQMVIVLYNLKAIKMRGITSEGMVMCACTPEKIEFLRPPEGAKPGDRVGCEGYDCSSPDVQIKKDLSDQILQGMKTNDKCEATFNGALWKMANGKGVIKATTMTNVIIK